jgi:hypothetical protein
MAKKLVIFGILLVVCVFLVFAASINLTPSYGESNSTPSSVFEYAYGNWSLTKVQDGSCAGGGSSTACWGTGVNAVNTTQDVYFWQDYEFNVSDINGTDISNLTLCFDACWTGGVNGCASSDRPEFDSTNGTAQLQIHNGVSYENVGTGINLGNNDAGSAYALATYCRTKTSGFVSGHVSSGIMKFRILMSGEAVDNNADVEMFTDYVVLGLNTSTPTTTTSSTSTSTSSSTTTTIPDGTTTTTLPTTTTTVKTGGGGGGGGGCRPDWRCDDWGSCDVYGYKYRYCWDNNKCNIIDGMPDEVAACSGAELCYNGLKDSGEEGIDCGGWCEPCIEEQQPLPAGAGEGEGEQGPVTQIPLETGICKQFEWPFWILYLVILLVSYLAIFEFNRAAMKLRKENLLKAMIAGDVVLFILALLDTVCEFRWYLLILLFVIFFTIVYLDWTLIRHRKIRLGKRK